MNDYRYYVIMNNPRTVTKQELEELNQELEKVIVRIQGKDKVKGILDDIEKCTELGRGITTMKSLGELGEEW